ncbi:hypothetical protein [Nocardioides ungokensis]|uniref:hypothetical protein n=1 Tax=Nocardioides ungokensis TaxID=1643322 RepID=UPI001FEB83C0|nr:hypothetical protein [Nocardioides ungokensis]
MTSESVTDRLFEEADALYGMALAEFTPARDARAKELKAGDAELAQRVKALRKPSTAAWVVNLLVRREAEQVGQVLAVGAALREAQANLAGDELRALTRQRRQLTAAVTARARAVAADLGLKVTSAVSDQVEATLTAAILDEDCAQAVRSGLLVAPLSATGVGDVDTSVRRRRSRRPSGSPPPRARPSPPRGPSCTSYPTPRRSGRRGPRPRPASRRRRRS